MTDKTTETSVNTHKWQASQKGFTLTELLIALAILALIAVFTIPKVLQSQQESKYNAMAKESAAMVSDAYKIYKARNGANGNMLFNELTPYMNYVSIDTSGTLMDGHQELGTINCASAVPCIRLHNGAVLWFNNAMGFGGTAATNGMWFHLDPDGKAESTTNGPAKSVQFWLMYSGRVHTRGTHPPNPCWSFGCAGAPNPPYDPPWFSWD